jgi:hypothetical protein
MLTRDTDMCDKTLKESNGKNQPGLWLPRRGGAAWRVKKKNKGVSMLMTQYIFFPVPF